MLFFLDIVSPPHIKLSPFSSWAVTRQLLLLLLLLLLRLLLLLLLLLSFYFMLIRRKYFTIKIFI